MRKKTPSASADVGKHKVIYQLRVVLIGVNPPVWRRVQVPGSFTLHKFHNVLQAAIGWTDSHLHQFVIRKQFYGVPDREFESVFGPPTINDKKYTLAELFPNRSAKFIYEYDFGDDWEHEILVERILAAEAGVSYPRCLAGKRACPPEDCGGYFGYEEMLETLADPKHEGREELLEWLGGEFDPEVFDLSAVNSLLKRIR